jgi:hypothetical protein
MLMSTSSAALGTFGPLLTEIETLDLYRRWHQEELRILAFPGLLRRLPNLRRLEWRSRTLDGLLQAITTGAGRRGIVELVLVDGHEETWGVRWVRRRWGQRLAQGICHRCKGSGSTVRRARYSLTSLEG